MNDTPFRIALVGGFGAGASRPPLAERRALRVDRDDFDAVLARVAPELTLSLGDGAAPARVAPRAMDDFHPDQLVASVEVFRELEAARERAPGGSGLERAVARIRAEADARRAGPPPAPATSARADDGSETLGLLERIVGAAAYEAAPAAGRGGDAELEQLIRRIVAPHVVAEPDERQRSWDEQVDRATVATMRAILAHPEFRALEQAWRGAELLVRRLDLDASLQLHLVDASDDELAADLAAHADDPARGTVARQLARVGERAWGIVVWLGALSDGDEDAALAGRLAGLGRAVGAPVVAAAQPALAGASGFGGEIDADGWRGAETPAWRALRESDDARWLGLVGPRLLLRVPYGAAGEPCERVAVEEVEDESSPRAHERYCWGSGALAVALLLGEAYADGGWALHAGHEVGGLPMHVRRVDGEAELVPCAEGRMYERGAERLLDRGIMPLAWMRDSDTVRLVRFQSVSRGGVPLAGRWDESR